MANLSEQLSTLNNRVDGLQSLITGKQGNPTLYAAVGQVILFGCKVTQGASATDYMIALESQAAGDTARLNPDLQSPPLYPFQFGNIASTKAAAFYANDLTTSVELPPTAGSGRYDIAYIAVGPTGPVFGMATGTASSAVRDDFIANGLRVSLYDSGTDAALPVGGLAVARIYVEGDVAGIPNARIADLRSFDGRLKGTAFTYADLTPTQKNELASGAITDVTALKNEAQTAANTATEQAQLAAEKTALTAADRVATLGARDEALAAATSTESALSTATQIITGDSVFLFNPRIVSADTILPSGFNATSAGPLEIAEGITVTVSDHSTWSIV